MTIKRKCLSSTALWSLLATLILLAAYFLPAYQRSVGAFDTSSVLRSLKASLLTPTFFWGQFGYYVWMVLLSHFLFFYLLAEVVRLRYAGAQRAWRTLLLWLAGVLFLQTVNSGFFPHSSLAFELSSQFGLDLLLPWVAAGMLAVLIVMGVVHLWWRGQQRWGMKLLLPAFVVLFVWLCAGGVRWLQAGPQRPLPADKPNIIMIGVDALRPDQLAYMHAYDPTYKSPMPFLDQQLAKSVVFTQAYTSTARTYPSWMAMLTGMDSLHSGVRYNLQDDYGWWEGKVRTLPQYLKKEGYQTVWGIDETSFANIGHRQGFDKVIAPAEGAASLLVAATIADIPLVNILSNSRYGGELFPLTSINRALGFSYYPSTFSNRLDDAVSHADRDKPLFMAVHFELAHYPTIWADDGTPTSIADIYNHANVGLPFYRYDLSRINQQVKELMLALKNSGRLDNAIVVFLSDHGNGFFTGKMGKNRFGEDVFVGDRSTGHGTDVTNLAQQQALLAIRGFGHYELKPGYRDNVVALMDITPTLLWTLGIKAHEPMQGLPLDVLGTSAQARRTVYFDLGMYFSGLGSGKLDLAKNLAKQAGYYLIKPNGRLVLRKEILPGRYSKQYHAAFDGRYMIALVWSREESAFTVGVINAKTGEIRELNNETIRLPGVAELGYDFCQHYSKNDPYFVPPAFCGAIAVK